MRISFLIFSNVEALRVDLSWASTSLRRTNQPTIAWAVGPLTDQTLRQYGTIFRGLLYFCSYIGDYETMLILQDEVTKNTPSMNAETIVLRQFLGNLSWSVKSRMRKDKCDPRYSKILMGIWWSGNLEMDLEMGNQLGIALDHIKHAKLQRPESVCNGMAQN